MKWIVMSPFTLAPDPAWVFEFIDRAAHQVRAVPAGYRHDRSRQSASARDWLDYLKHGLRGFTQAAFGSGRTGCITVFPQLALVLALFKKLSGRHQMPLIAWCFNLGRPYGGIKGRVAQYCLSEVDMFVVHSRAEIDIYSRWLKLPPERFMFVPLSVEMPAQPGWHDPDGAPYIVALGTANRDYSLLSAAAGQLGYKTIIVAGAHAVAHLTPPACVSFQSGLSLAECHRLALGARINVIPIADISAPSGQVTVIESMMLGVPLVATACAGTFDYIDDGADGLLVPPGDVEAMAAALRRLWDDAGLRQALSLQARRAAEEKFTFKAASAGMLRLMNQLERRA